MNVKSKDLVFVLSILIKLKEKIMKEKIKKWIKELLKDKKVFIEENLLISYMQDFNSKKKIGQN
jgi:hypothetical protein